MAGKYFVNLIRSFRYGEASQISAPCPTVEDMFDKIIAGCSLSRLLAEPQATNIEISISRIQSGMDSCYRAIFSQFLDDGVMVESAGLVRMVDALDHVFKVEMVVDGKTRIYAAEVLNVVIMVYVNDSQAIWNSAMIMIRKKV